MSKKGRHEEHEHENEERWLISYADFITLLMALFIVMYAMSNVDKARFQKLAVSLSGAFNVASRSPVNLPSLPGRKGDTLAASLKDRPTPPTAPSPEAPESIANVLSNAGPSAGEKGEKMAPPGDQQDTRTGKTQEHGAKDVADKDLNGRELAAKELPAKELSPEVLQQAKNQMFASERKTLEKVKEKIDVLLKMQGLEGQASVTLSKSGQALNVRLPDNLLFKSGSADLASEASPVLDKMATIIDQSDQAVRIEGHTDNIPMRSGRYVSNWELSTARATSVLKYLQEMGSIPPSKLSAAGYGEFRPLTENDSPEGRAKNRRVEFVITAEDMVN